MKHKSLLFLITFSDCHICHEEIKPIIILLSFVPLLGTYVSGLWQKLHSKKCIHTETSFMFNVSPWKKNPELTKLYRENIRKERYDAFLTPAPILKFSHYPPYISYNLDLPKIPNRYKFSFTTKRS